MFYTIANEDPVVPTVPNDYFSKYPLLTNRHKGMHVYILDNKDQRIGVLAVTDGYYDDKNVVIGWSLCNFTAGDRFDTELGVKIAYERSAKHSIAPVPMSILPRYEAFLHRAKKYYKNKTVLC
jgi:hypothetical protein